MCSITIKTCAIAAAVAISSQAASAEQLPVDSTTITIGASADMSAAAPAVSVESSTIIVTAKRQPVRVNPHLLSDDQLGEQRGGTAITITNQTLAAITQGNVLNGDFTAGDVSISDNALSGFNGVGNILINTGAQVSLQAGMNLTISMTGE
jgi:hypothetical protein